ncbi:MAG: GNAT family N-acetyltransferase [Anaerolineae bacterium]|jgi:GNAT superfamily N-acetyltransferase|nr:GNAT family N-acetyltransferase [Anaerolineae bacterium]
MISELLSWDSDFFGLRIARIPPTITRLTPELLAEVETWCHANAIDCLYFLADPFDPITVRLAETHHFRLTDTRTTVHRAITDQSFTAAENVRLFQPADLAHLRPIARTSYSDSRFYFDRCFARERCDALYQTWLERSVDGSGFADFVFVYELNGLPVGYITGSKRNTMGSIGIVGVSEAARGHSIGSALLQTALKWFSDEGLTHVNIVTQGRNLGALKFYQRNGFFIHEIAFWYHRWFKNCYD